MLGLHAQQNAVVVTSTLNEKSKSIVVLAIRRYKTPALGCKECCEDASADEGWVFGGYLSDNEPIKEYLKKDEINLNWLIGSWENENSIIHIRSDGTFHHGYKESEGFTGTWSILGDGTLYISDCQIYDEDPWNTTYKVKVCLQDRLTLIAENGWVCDLHNLKSQ